MKIWVISMIALFVLSCVKPTTEVLHHGYRISVMVSEEQPTPELYDHILKTTNKMCFRKYGTPVRWIDIQHNRADQTTAVRYRCVK